MGFWDSIFGIAEKALDVALEYSQAEMERKIEEQERLEMENTIELVKALIERLKEIINSIDGEIEELENALEEKNEENIWGELAATEVIASMLGDEQWIKNNCEEPYFNIDEMTEFMENWRTISKFTDETFPETDEEEGCVRQHTEIDSERFAYRMHVMLEDIEEKDIYQSAQQAISYMNDFKKSLKSAICHWNYMIEDGYRELCGEDEEDDF
ncbi:MAG: hypothetical protein KH296_05345 [Ruminococcus sp.]|nr:hypothetical protein [Ruminococcus sp.]